MTDNFKIEDMEVETTETRKKYGKDEEKLETVTIQTIQIPNYQYWSNQDTIDAKIGIRNIQSSLQYISLEMSGSQNITTSTQTQITSFDTSGSSGSAASISWQTIVINTAWRYQVSMGCYLWNSASWLRNHTLVVNGSNRLLVRAFNDWNWNSQTYSTFIDSFSVWDVLRFDVFQSSWSTLSAQTARLSVLFMG